LVARGRFDEADAVLREAVARFPQFGLLAEHAADLVAQRAVAQPAASAHPMVQRVPHRVGLMELAVSSELLLEAADFHAPACITYTNYPVLDPAAGMKHLRGLYIPGVLRIEPIRLAELPAETDLIVAGAEDFIPIHEGRILADQVPPYWRHDAIPEVLGAPRPRVDIDGSAVLIARYGLRTWGHWLDELLPKMICVEAAFPGKHRYVLPASIFHDPVLRTLRESISYHGIDLARIIPVRPNTVYRFAELHAVSSVWTNHKIHPGAAGLMRRRIKPTPADMPRKVAFLRTESLTRNVVNAPAIIDLLQHQGFAMVEIGRLPFADQVATFAAARTIVAVLGSGLSGLLYAPEGIRVLTLAPTRWSDLFFFALMQNRDASLADIRGPQDSADPRSPAAAGFVVELDEVKLGLQALGA
jgi:hypothetical protein